MLRRGWHFGKMPLGLRRVKLGGFGPSSTVRERQSTERRLGRSELSELCSCSTESAQKNPCQGPPRTEPPGRPPESPGGDATRQSQFPASIGRSAIGASPNRPQAPQRHQAQRTLRSEHSFQKTGRPPGFLPGPRLCSQPDGCPRLDEVWGPAGRTALGFRTWAKCRGSFSNASLSRDCIAWRDHRTTAPRRFVPTPTTKLWTMRTRSEDLKISNPGPAGSRWPPPTPPAPRRRSTARC